MRDYLWASSVGRIRIIEKGLLTRSDLGKVLDADNLEGALTALRDSFYGPYLSGLENPAAFEGALEEAAKGAHDGVMELAPEPMVIAAYKARYDFHNLKVLLKAKTLGVPGEKEAFTNLGNLSPMGLKETLKASDEGSFPNDCGEREPDSVAESLVKITLQLVEVYARVGQEAAREKSSSFQVDSRIDQAYYAWAWAVYGKLGYPALIEFIKTEIDIVNLKMAVRAKLWNISGLDFPHVVIAGGAVDSSRLGAAYLGGFGDIARVYENTPFHGLAKKGVSLARDGQSLTSWERECDNVMVKIIREAGSTCLGPEPVIGYLYGREIEVKNLRIILSGKQALISEDEISGRLRESYA